MMVCVCVCHEVCQMPCLLACQDVKYKTKESKDLDKAVAESSSDRSTVQEELDAVLEYYSKIKGECIAKAEPYAERKERREAEIAGLKEAPEIGVSPDRRWDARCAQRRS